jgi:MipA family protein
MTIKLTRLAGLAFSLLAVHDLARAETAPLWELGLGVGAVSFPAYRGSDERQNFVLPTPYFVYRGAFVKADRNGLRSVFFDSDRVELNLSASASVPVDSDRIDARRGMPDLKPTAELGPSLDFHLWRGDRYRFDLRLPLRYAFSLESSPRCAGWQFTPRFVLDIRDPAGLEGWNLGMLVGPVYGSKRQHDYFYSVAPRYATVARPAYDAPGGYAGWQVLGSVSKRFERFWVGGFIRHDSLRGAVFDDSPLVTDTNYLAGGVAVAWIIGESETLIRKGDD